MSVSLERTLNVLALYALSFVLAFAFFDQIKGGVLPCPLCLLQRAGFAAVGAGVALNVLVGPASRHYGLMILGAMAGGAVALRQVALHVVPGTGGYGAPVAGLHLYSWAFVLFGAVLVGCGAMLALRGGGEAAGRPGRGVAGTLAAALFLALVAGNGVATLAECGGGLCPDNPTAYEGYDALRRWLDAAPDAPAPAGG